MLNSGAPRRLVASLVAGLLTVGLAGCGSDKDAGQESGPESGKHSMDVVHVPKDASTLAKAADLVAKNGLILVSPGTYKESVTLKTPGVTLRGMDRNKVILDGEGRRANGVVGTTSGLTVENLTVRSYLLNGVLMTGVTDSSGAGIGRGSDGYQPVDPTKFPPVSGFAIRYVTASNNGLYGLYAFNRQDGIIEHSHASGSADSGVYVGQCKPCNVVVRDNVLEANAVGMEFANASAPLLAINNTVTDNRLGMLAVSNYQETYQPLTGSVFAGNQISNNNNPETPAQATGAFGMGVALTGPKDVQLLRNRIEGNVNVGVQVGSNVDLAPVGVKAEGNQVSGGALDWIYVPTAQALGVGNCIRIGAGEKTFPAPLPTSATCGGPDNATPTAPPLSTPAPAGLPFLDVPLPGDQPTLPGDPASLPHPVAAAPQLPTLNGIVVPPALPHG